MKTLLRNRLYTAISCLLGTLAATGAMSSARADEQTPISRVVHFGDLDIGTPAGAKVLYHRIRVAASEVCEPSVTRDLARVQAAHACIEAAVDKAVKQVNSVELTELRFGAPLLVARK
jgi:UrcA family protein